MTDDAYAGPASPTPEQYDAVVDLTHRVFRADGPHNLPDQFPLLFDRSRPEQMRFYEHEGKPVALVCTVTLEAEVFGARPKVACLGAVCTETEHRGHGLASRLLVDAAHRSRGRGASLMYISGERGLYTRFGAHPAGRFAIYRLKSDQLPDAGDDLRVEPVDEGNVKEAQQLYESTPIHWRLDDQQYAASSTVKFYFIGSGATFLVRRNGSPVATLTGWITESNETLHVCDMAGDAAAGLAALSRLNIDSSVHPRHVLIEAYPHNDALRQACEKAGAEREIAPLPLGTVKLLDAERLWADMQPLLRERIGEAAGKIEVSQSFEDTNVVAVKITRGKENVVVEGVEQILHVLLGCDDKEPPGLPGPLGEQLQQALPLPISHYSLGFV